MRDYLLGIGTTRVVFTAGDLREGLESLSYVYRRAIIFGLEQRLSAAEVVELTHADVHSRTLTPFAESVVAHSEIYPRLQCVFWVELSNGLISPLFDLEIETSVAFGGMTWHDLQSAYSTMVWVDHEQEASDFLAVARQQGVL